MTDSAVPSNVSEIRERPPRRRIRATQLLLMHDGMNVSRYLRIYVAGAMYPLIAGFILFGWRAVGTMIVVLASTTAAIFVWRRIGSRGIHLRYDHGLWMALLLTLMLPAHLFSGSGAMPVALWPILAAGGILLVIFIWLLGGLGSGRVHPVLITYLVLFVLFKQMMVPQYILQRRHVFFGDLISAPANISPTAQLPWLRAPEVPNFDAVRIDPATQTLIEYTTVAPSRERAWISLDSLLRDRMPPLEDLIVGGHPGPIGGASQIAVIMGGLFLLYHGLIDFRVPLFIFLAAMIAMLVLPVPVVIKENDAVWRWTAMREHDVGWQIGLTLANYELM